MMKHSIQSWDSIDGVPMTAISIRLKNNEKLFLIMEGEHSNDLKDKNLNE